MLLFLIALSFLVAGVVEESAQSFASAVGLVAVIHLIALAFLGFAWCKAHVASRGIREPTGSAFWVGAIAIIGVPLYFFRSMPWRQAAWSTLKALGFLILCLLLHTFGALVSDQAVSSSAFRFLAGDAALQAPTPAHPILGTWHFMVPGTDCTERYEFVDSGVSHVVSGTEQSESVYRVTPSSNSGLYVLEDIVTKSNGGTSCSGAAATRVGDKIVLFLRFTSGIRMMMCTDRSEKFCMGPFVKVSR
ncbi:MAG: hypothetical protein EPO48_03595 [Nevskiaceae bacterium]|nr:MAG: hypothetical protein EPO48_03595 [Nevskiaceae bacterium]